MGTRVILVVEDNPDHALLVRIAVQRASSDLEIRVVDDGAKAIAYLQGDEPFGDREAYPLPTLVILDLMLPEVSGFDVLEWIRGREELASLAVAVLTSSVNPRDRRRVLELGADGFYTKPADLVELGNMVEEMVRESVRARRAREP